MNPLKTIIKDSKKIPLGVKLIVLVIFLRMVGWGFVDPFFSIFIQSFGESYTAVGAFVSLISVISLLVMLPLIRLADKVQDSRILQDGEIFYLFTIIFYMAAGIYSSVPLLLIAFVLNGIAHPFVLVGAESYIRKHGGQFDNGKSFGYYTALNYFGWILGMIIAAYIVPYRSFNLMFLFVLPSIIASLFILPRIRERGFKSFFTGLKRYFHKAQDFKDLIQDIRTINKKMYFFLFLAFFDGVITMFKFVFIPLFALAIDLNMRQIALFMAVMYLPFIFSFFFSEVTDRFKKMNVIAMGLFIGAISYILLSFIVKQEWVVVLASTTSLALAIIRPAYNGVITALTPRRMLGEITGLNNLMVKLGHIVGPIFSGVIADVYGIQVAFFIIALVAFGLGMITLLMKEYDSVSAVPINANS
ncbi:MFS transporter [Candidatus Peregrinibacteria bacterium]|nr:MFS transporter [Candidatus Peregrinibacteria bacterium]